MLAQCCMINLPGRRFIGTWEFVVRAPTTILQLLHSAITRATSSIRCCPSASQNSTKSRVEARIPDLNAAPYPRGESWFMTSAPAWLASISVLSVEPSFTTMISELGKLVTNPRTTCSIDCSSFKAGTMILTSLWIISPSYSLQILLFVRFGKANGATDETFDPCPEVDVLAFNFLRMLLPTSCCSGSICRSYAPNPSV